MKTRKMLRSLGFVAVGLIALGALGYAAGGRDTSTHTTAVDQAAGAPDDVMASIDKALGRDSTGQAISTYADPSAIAIAPMPPVAADAVKSLPPTAGGAPAQREATNGAIVAGSPPVIDPNALASIDDRKIVQTASLQLQVKDVGGGFEEVGRIATSAGGFVASSNFSLQGDQQIASATVRVPAAGYQDVLRQLRALGVKVDSEASNASDVTQQYSDLGAQLRSLQATETQLLTLLGQAKNVSEVLQVQDRLTSIRTQIEQVQGRMTLFDKLSDLATISVHLRPVVAASSSGGGTDLGREVSDAWQASLDFLGGIAAGVLRVVVFVWWLPLVAVPVYVIGGRYLRSRSAPSSAVD